MRHANKKTMMTDDKPPEKDEELYSSDALFTDNDDEDLCQMTREETEVQSNLSTASVKHTPEFSSELVGELDLL